MPGCALVSGLKPAGLWGGVALCSALTASPFLLLRQKKGSKEKATPSCAVGCADSPVRLRRAGRLAKLAYGSDRRQPTPPGPSPLLGAFHGGGVHPSGFDRPSLFRRKRGAGSELGVLFARLSGAGLVMEQTLVAAAVTWVCRLGKAGPVCATQPRCISLNTSRRSTPAKPENSKPNPIISKPPAGCLSPWAALSNAGHSGELGWRLSEPKASLASPPNDRVAQGTRVAGANPGSRFLWRLSFGETKESLPAGQRRNTALQQWNTAPQQGKAAPQKTHTPGPACQAMDDAAAIHDSRHQNQSPHRCAQSSAHRLARAPHASAHGQAPHSIPS